MSWRRLWFWLFVGGLSCFGEEAKPPVSLSLICEVRSFAPGTAFTVGLSLQHQPGFHTYWHSPGTVGLPTMVKWDLPEGYEVGELQWPTPERCTMEGYNTHGYNRDVVLLATVTPPADAKPGPVTLKAAVTYMACAKEKCCNLQYGNQTLTLQCAAKVVADPVGGAAIAAAREELPQPYAGVTSQFSQSRDHYYLTVDFRMATSFPPAASLYFYGDGQLVDSIKEQRTERTPTGYRLTLPRTDYGPEKPELVTGLLYSADKWPGSNRNFVPLRATRAPAK